MKKRVIPALDRSTAPIGLGCMGMSWAYNTPGDKNDAAHIEVIRGALDRGITFIDTSDAYASGHNEQLVGKAAAGRREDAIIATKGGLLSSYVDGVPTVTRDARPEHLREAIDRSLTRLGVDHIDLYYLHRIDPVVPLEDSWAVLAEAQQAGKILALGLSEVTTSEATAAHSIAPVAAIQSELSLWTREAIIPADDSKEGSILEWCSDHDAIFVPFSPLGRGFLTGTLNTNEIPPTDLRATLPRFTGDAATENSNLLGPIRAVAQRHGTTPAAVALAWVLAQGDNVIPIPGTTKLSRLDENLASANFTLETYDLAQLDGLPAALGTRY